MKLIRSAAKKFQELIHKGLHAENEASQFFVMMRVYYLITAAYIVVFDIFAICTGMAKSMPILIIWLPLHLLSFFSTYRFSRRVTFHIFSVGILSWLVIAVCLMGWDYGAQFFLYPLMVISFFATYKNYLGKAIYTFVLFVLHFSMYFYAKHHEPLVQVSETWSLIMHLMNTITLFVCMFALCFAFSNTNQSMMEKLAQYNKKLKQDAETDTLTGLINRRRMYQTLDEAMQNKSARPISLAMGDIDFFKKINDTMGHNCGDAVLKNIAAYFKQSMADKGIVCRWGGEEFLFLFPAMDGGSARSFVQHMKDEVAALPISYDDEIIHITMTFGVAEYSDGTSASDWVKAVDDKLYIGKNSGRNVVIL